MALPSLAKSDDLRQELRHQMSVTQRWAYFDHAAVAPLSDPARDAVVGWARQASDQGDVRWPEWAKGVEKTRRCVAQLIGAQPSEVALTPNTTYGINLVAEGIDWRRGDNVVILDDEFPANVYPWMHQQDRGVELRRVETESGQIDLDQFRQACDSRTRVVSVSWVGYLTGYRQEIDAIAEIAHQRGAFFFLDAIQGMGVFPIDVRRTPVDFMAADGHKWMLGPEGAGFAYLRQDHLERLRPIGVGWNSVVHPHDFTTIDYRLRPEAGRYEGGSSNMPGMLALGASLAFLQSWPTKDIAGAILDLTDLACERLAGIDAKIVSHRDVSSLGHDPRSGIVAFELPGRDPIALRRQCLEAGVALSSRGGRLRISAHAYNNAQDVDRLIDALTSS